MKYFNLDCSHIPYEDVVLCLESWKAWDKCDYSAYGENTHIRVCEKYRDA